MIKIFFKLNCVIIALIYFTESAPTASQTRGTWNSEKNETQELFEGDILRSRSIESFLKNGLLSETFRWPNATVVYELDPLFTSDEIKTIFSGWEEISDKTCIKFRHRCNNETDYVYVKKGIEDKCSAAVGKQGGKQELHLGPNCTQHLVIVHEMLHTIGFYHEQSRTDRDKYVTINFDKVEPGLEYNFMKYPNSTVTDFGSPYDYGSIMHYGSTDFSIDKTPTIIPKIPGVTLGATNMSQIDAGKVILMYNCPY